MVGGEGGGGREGEGGGGREGEGGGGGSSSAAEIGRGGIVLSGEGAGSALGVGSELDVGGGVVALSIIAKGSTSVSIRCRSSSVADSDRTTARKSKMESETG